MVKEIKNQEEQAPFDVAIERTKKALSKNPQISAADLFTRFVEPLLGELRSEYSEQLADVMEVVETLELPDEDVVDQAKNLVLLLGNLIDNTFVRAGWVNQQGVTEKMPPDIRQAFQQATAETRAFFERLAEMDAEDDEDDEEEEDDEEDDEDEDEEADDEDAVAATPTVGGGVA